MSPPAIWPDLLRAGMVHLLLSCCCRLVTSICTHISLSLQRHNSAANFGSVLAVIIIEVACCLTFFCLSHCSHTHSASASLYLPACLSRAVSVSHSSCVTPYVVYLTLPVSLYLAHSSCLTLPVSLCLSHSSFEYLESLLLPERRLPLRCPDNFHLFHFALQPFQCQYAPHCLRGTCSALCFDVSWYSAT